RCGRPWQTTSPWWRSICPDSASRRGARTSCRPARWGSSSSGSWRASGSMPRTRSVPTSARARCCGQRPTIPARSAASSWVLAPPLSTLTTPVQILVGRDDPYGLATDAQLLDRQLPHSRLQILACGHNAWEEEPAEYGGAIVEWVNGGYLRV